MGGRATFIESSVRVAEIEGARTRDVYEIGGDGDAGSSLGHSWSKSQRAI